MHVFTGLVEDVGRVVEVSRRAREVYFSVASSRVCSELEIGDSVSVNGACLTVVSKSDQRFTAAATAETLRRTNLGLLTVGSRVNLERALRLGDRLGGHLVLGHVDGLGHVSQLAKEGEALLMTITPPSDLLPLIVPKGSITVDGVSLTVATLLPDAFTVSLIPHTLGVTTLQERRVGDLVNLEGDIIGKYVARFFALGAEPVFQEESHGPPSSDISLDVLRQHGFA
jgi:riboflavin synthase